MASIGALQVAGAAAALFTEAPSTFTKANRWIPVLRYSRTVL